MTIDAKLLLFDILYDALFLRRLFDPTEEDCADMEKAVGDYLNSGAVEPILKRYCSAQGTVYPLLNENTAFVEELYGNIIQQSPLLSEADFGVREMGQF